MRAVPRLTERHEPWFILVWLINLCGKIVARALRLISETSGESTTVSYVNGDRWLSSSACTGSAANAACTATVRLM